MTGKREGEGEGGGGVGKDNIELIQREKNYIKQNFFPILGS